MSDTTTIQVTSKTAVDLYDMQGRGESYEDVVSALYAYSQINPEEFEEFKDDYNE